MRKIIIWFFTLSLSLALFAGSAFAEGLGDTSSSGLDSGNTSRSAENKAVFEKKLQQEKQTRKGKENQILVKYRDGRQGGKSFTSSLSKKIKTRKKLRSNVEVLDTDSTSDPDKIISELKNDNSVLFAEKNEVRQVQAVPNDPNYLSQWALSNIMAEQGWSCAESQASAGKTVKVAVIDSGVDLSNADLAGRISTGGYNFLSDNTDVTDLFGHGTEVSAVLAAQTDNGIGIAGVTGNFHVEIVPLKVVYNDGSAYVSDVVDAINYAVSQKVDVISLSLGYFSYSSIENAAIQNAIQNGIVVVAAAGNYGEAGAVNPNYLYPASYDNVISVSSINEANTRSYNSSFNDKVDVAAPGENILTYGLNSQLISKSGTSFSTPVVSGIAAVLKALRPTLTANQVENIIESSSIDLGTTGKDKYYGYGKVNLYQAVKRLLPPDAPTSPVENDIFNKFGWTNTDGFQQPTDYEFSIDSGASWTTCTTNPQIIPDSNLATGSVQVRVKSDSSITRPAGSALLSDSPYTSTPVVSFSFDGPNAGRLMNIKTFMEYSLDGGTTYTQAMDDNLLLTSVQISKIKASTDIKVRVKATASDIAGPIQTIDILSGPAAPAVKGNDSTNTISGMDSTMEFTKDGGSTWTRYVDVSSLGDIRGSVSISVRICATGTTAAGSNTSMTFTAGNPALKLTAARSSSFTEGKEDGELITVTMTNCDLNSNLTLNDIQVTGLPTGVTKGSLQLIDKTTCTINLSGNSTVDYDSDPTVTVTIPNTMLTPLQSSNISGTVKLKATVESTPAAPTVSFSYDGANAGKLIGANATMEFSLDGGTTYLPVTADNQQLNASLLDSITAANDIRIRTAATLRVPAGTVKTVDILSGPAAPAVTGNDDANTVSGMDTTMEFFRNSETSWTKYVNAASLGSLQGTFTLKIRTAGKGATMPGAVTTLQFTGPVLPPALSASFAGTISEGSEDGGQMTLFLTYGDLDSSITQSDILITGLPAGVTTGPLAVFDSHTLAIKLSGNSTVDYDTDQTITVTIPGSKVIPAQSNSLSATLQLKATVEPTPAAPAVSFSFDGSSAGRLVGITPSMEYSLDGGNTYSPATGNDMTLSPSQVGAISPSSDIKVRAAANLRTPPGVVETIDILLGPAAPLVSSSDTANTVSGMDTTMEFSKDGGSSWTRYTNAGSLGDLSGNVTLLVRIPATGVTCPSAVVPLSFTAAQTSPTPGALPSISAVVDPTLTAGHEDGKLITVTVVNGTFVSSLDSSKIQLAGLPAGVSKNAVTLVNAHVLTIKLSGNSTAPYASSLSITISISSSQIVLELPDSYNCGTGLVQ